MRTRLLLLLLSLGALAGTPSAQQPPSAAVRSPEVSGDRRVTFRIAAPKAAAVSVICECLTLEELAKLKADEERLASRPAADPEKAALAASLANVRANQGERPLVRDAAGVWTLTLPAVEPDL